MTRPSAFLVIPWQQDFLQGLLRRALEDTEGDISRACFLFPHSRAARYMTLLLYKEPGLRRPLLLPRMHTVSGLFSEFSSRLQSRPAWNAGLLDRVGLLLSCVREETRQEPLDTPSPLTDARRFFPWGLRLASLFEECFSQLRRPVDFLHTEGQVSPFAQMLLERLGAIFSRYEKALAKREWTSPGHDAFLVAQFLRQGGQLPLGLLPETPEQPLYIAGFHILTGAENTLFHHLWEKGAQVVLHADPDLAGPERGKNAHWSCRALQEWAEAWRAGIRLLLDREHRREKPPPRLRYYAGFDLHSQLQILQRELTDLEGNPDRRETSAPKHTAGDDAMKELTEAASFAAGTGAMEMAEQAEEAAFALLRENSYPNQDHMADTAIILPDSSLLMPVLHHLPQVDINVSMGYPLTRSPLFRLLDTLARLQEKRKDRGYYWRDLVDLFRHPYIKMLLPESEKPGATKDASVRRELHRLEQSLRQRGSRYLDPQELLLDEYQFRDRGDLPPAHVLALLEQLFRTTLTAFEDLRSPRELATALEGVCALLLNHGRHLWDRFPIDAECLYRLRQSLIPELSRSELAGEHFPSTTLFVILRSLLEAERVPFEAAPLVGLQVLGMLESRLLSFRRVIVVDAVESNLPGTPAGDPLLPEALRPELGLPAPHSREQVSAYHFFRLAAGAAEVILLWQEGGEGPGLQDQKKKKSRFVEELLWREEQKLGRLLAARGEDGPLTILPGAIESVPRTWRGITVTPSVQDLLRSCLLQPVSASFLDSYLRCPVRFFYERAAGLDPTDEVREGDDPLAIGNLLHTILYDVYQECQGQALPGGEELARTWGGEVLAALGASPDFLRLRRLLPADSFAMLAAAGRKRLSDYLLHQPPTVPLALEQPLHASFSCQGFSCKLMGKADRIDLRTGLLSDEEASAGIVIVDYKTGHVPVPNSELWQNADLWQRMEDWQPGSDPSGQGDDQADPLLDELAQSLESIQLPLYLLLYSLAAQQGCLPELLENPTKLPALDACWVSLSDKGQEIPLFPRSLEREKRQEIVKKLIPQLVRFLLRHMLESPMLLPRPGQHCDWCSCAKLCMVSAASARG